MTNSFNASYLSSSSVGWPSNSSLSADDLRMDKRSTLQVHQPFFDQLNDIANMEKGLLKGHWLHGINSGDECAIRQSVDGALARSKWVAVKALHLYAKALKEHLPAGSCGFSHTDRIRGLIGHRLQSEQLLNELNTIDPSQGVNVIGDQNSVNVNGEHHVVNVIGNGNQVTVTGNPHHVAAVDPVTTFSHDEVTRPRHLANPNNSDILLLRENGDR
jgi:hypothetical protein